MRSRKCDTTVNNQLFEMEHLSGALFKGRKNAANEVGVFRLHSKTNENQCLTWTGGGCAKYMFTQCKMSPRETDNQVFHLSHFLDDKDDADVFNWAGADGRAMDANSCRGFKDGNEIWHCSDNLNQAKRWQMLDSPTV